MAKEIKSCRSWEDSHPRPVYTFEEKCPECGGDTAPAAPARFSPHDPYGSYRRALLRTTE